MTGEELVIENVDPRSMIKVLVEIYRRAYAGIEVYAYRRTPDIVGYMKWLYKRAPDGFLAAFLGGEPVGFIAVDDRWMDHHGKPIGEIHEFAVDPTFQGQGIGTRLCLAGLEVLRNKGHRRFGLWVGEYNTKAQRFYEKLGFRKVGQWGIWIRMEKEEEPSSP
ncbi:MAG: GNAT family N-acetyltransferase [Armatimonadota bacterium]|nr:GNAT family N-acetyltransferase [Armatimonadota bacterium]MDR5703443.1 GNAT family N-acetyltransferase [Armatimonadota bacterium]